MWHHLGYKNTVIQKHGYGHGYPWVFDGLSMGYLWVILWVILYRVSVANIGYFLRPLMLLSEHPGDTPG